MAKGIFLNRVPSIVTATLRKLDDHGLLGKNLMVIGTHAMYGYESVAGVQFDVGLMATTDVDLLWDARATLKLAFRMTRWPKPAFSLFCKVDRSFEPVRKGDFRGGEQGGFLR